MDYLGFGRELIAKKSPTSEQETDSQNECRRASMLVIEAV